MNQNSNQKYADDTQLSKGAPPNQFQSQFNSVKKNFNHPTKGNFVVVMAGS